MRLEGRQPPMNFADLTIRRILSALNGAKLTVEHQTLIKDHLSGCTDSTALKSLTEANYHSFYTSDLYKIMLAFLQEENYGEARILFDVLFAIGQSDSYRWLPVNEMKIHYSQLFTPQTAYQYLAVYTDASIRDPNQIKSSVIQSLEAFEIDFEGLKKTIESQKGYTGIGDKAMLLPSISKENTPTKCWRRQTALYLL